MVVVAAERRNDLPKRLAAFIGGVLLALLLSFSLVATVPEVQRWVVRMAGLNGTEPMVIVKRVRVPVTQVAECGRPEAIARPKGIKRLASYKKGKPRIRRAARRLPLCGVDPGVTPSEYGLSEARDPRTSAADPFTTPIGEAFDSGLTEPTQLAELTTPFGPALITPVTSGGSADPQPIAVPEPENWVQMIVGLGAVSVMVRMRRGNTSSPTGNLRA